MTSIIRGCSGVAVGSGLGVGDGLGVEVGAVGVGVAGSDPQLQEATRHSAAINQIAPARTARPVDPRQVVSCLRACRYIRLSLVASPMGNAGMQM
jgi:hypothetical protein